MAKKLGWSCLMSIFNGFWPGIFLVGVWIDSIDLAGSGSGVGKRISTHFYVENGLDCEWIPFCSAPYD